MKSNRNTKVTPIGSKTKINSAKLDPKKKKVEKTKKDSKINSDKPE